MYPIIPVSYVYVYVCVSYYISIIWLYKFWWKFYFLLNLSHTCVPWYIITSSMQIIWKFHFFLAQIATKWLMENFTNPASWLIKLLIPCHWPAWVKQFQWSQFLLGTSMGLLWKTQWKLSELTLTIETYCSTMCGFNISSYNGVLSVLYLHVTDMHITAMVLQTVTR